LRERGYLPERDFELLIRYADGHLERSPALARELVELKPALIVTASNVTTIAVAEADSSIPVVCSALFDPVGRGLAASDAKPGGQITGLHYSIPSLPGKQLEMLRELLPRAFRIGHLVHSSNRVHENVATAASQIGITAVPVEVGSPDDLEAAFDILLREGVSAVLIFGAAIFVSEHRRIVALAAKAKLPTLYGWREFVDAGGLISYAVNLSASFRRASAYVDKILKGERAGDLPIELPQLELVINLKTAAALGLTIPPTLLARADEVIE
jgi:putative ABC transport system substrate-binding protein